MDCKTARLLLDFHRPQASELPAADVADLERHLSLCPECAQFSHVERLADQHLGRALREIPVPDGLRDRIVTRLAADRRAATCRKLAWAGRALAAAAAILLVVGLVWFWRETHPPALDVAGLLNEEMDQTISPNPDWVEQWFATREDLRVTAPPQFEYRFLAYFGAGRWQGKRVPHFVFVRGDLRASVYVVTREQFDLERLRQIDPSQLDTAGYHVQIWADLEQYPDTAFVIIYRGEGLEPLLRSGNGPAI